MTDNLVTGAAGFVGQHLVAALLRRGESVVGIVLKAPPRLTTLSEAEAARVTWVQANLEERDQVREAVRAYPARRIFHLAAVSSVRLANANPAAALSVNVIGTLNLLTELADLPRDDSNGRRVLITSSSEVYGAAAGRCRPLHEGCPLEPLSVYAVSKAAQELLGLQFRRARGLAVVIARSFNHTGPGQRPPFVAAELALQIASATRGDGVAVVRVGNPEVRRDFSDVRDVVRAYVALAERGEPGGVYNVCSGRAYAIAQLVELLADIAGVTVRVELDPDRAHAVDVPAVVGDASKLTATTGWSPEIDIRDTLAGLLDSLPTD